MVTIKPEFLKVIYLATPAINYDVNVITELRVATVVPVDRVE